MDVEQEWAVETLVKVMIHKVEHVPCLNVVVNVGMKVYSTKIWAAWSIELRYRLRPMFLQSDGKN